MQKSKIQFKNQNLPLTIAETQKKLMANEFTASELVESYLERIESQKDLNAFLTVTAEKAREQAKATDRLLGYKDMKILSERPLLGVITAYKDLYLTKGIKTTAASKVLESFVPEYSSTVVRRMENAGAIMIGKTNCDAWAHGASGENSDFGSTKNPWNKEYVPGGSSSGSACAVASGMSLVAMGTDTGGSVRQPAGFCGLVGLKPTYGAISRYGVIAMASSLDTMGSFAHSVDDVEIIFNAIKGPDGLDSTVVDHKPAKPKDKYKIGIAKEFFVDGLDAEVKSKIDEAVKVFESMGISVSQITLPNTKYAIPVYYIVQPAEVSSNLGRYDGIRYGNKRENFGDEAKRRIMLGTYVLSAGYYDAYYLKAQKVRSLIIRDFDRAFEDVDAILSPVSPTPPFKIGEKSDDPLQMYLADIYTAGANLAGIPGLALPFEFSKKGLPIGFQLLGPRFSENVLFDLGRKFHKEIDFKPKIAS